MRTLDLLVSKFKEVKEELEKNSLPLHNTVPEFLAGLKAIPKGDPARGKFMTAHMNHGPFLAALQSHPQGKQIHGMLTAHLNSPQNAGFKPGQVQTMVKNDEDVVEKVEEELEKGFKNPTMRSQALNDAFKDSLKPQQSTPSSAPALSSHPNTLPSPEEHAARASTYSDFMPPGKFSKGEIKFAKNGQWSLDKAEYDYTGGAKEAPAKESGVKGALKRAGNKILEAGVKMLDSEKNRNKSWVEKMKEGKKD